MGTTNPAPPPLPPYTPPVPPLPNPYSPYTPSLIRAIRGPVMLITIGALGVLDHFTSYPYTLTWPVIIIVFGLLKLGERAGGRA